MQGRAAGLLFPRKDRAAICDAAWEGRKDAGREGGPIKATEFEFRRRAVIIGFIFTAAYCCYFFEAVPSGELAAEWLAGRTDALTLEGFARAIYIFAAVLVLAAAAMRAWGTSYLGESVMRDARVHSEQLLADGPFRHVRHPLYFGNILMATGFAFLAPPAGFFVLVAGMTIFVLRLAGREEAALAAEQGKAFREYCARVPRLLPSLRPLLPPGGAHPKWREGVLGETAVWFWAIALAVFAATLWMSLFWAVFIAGWVVEIIRRRLLRARCSSLPGAPPGA